MRGSTCGARRSADELSTLRAVAQRSEKQHAAVLSGLKADDWAISARFYINAFLHETTISELRWRRVRSTRRKPRMQIARAGLVPLRDTAFFVSSTNPDSPKNALFADGSPAMRGGAAAPQLNSMELRKSRVAQRQCRCRRQKRWRCSRRRGENRVARRRGNRPAGQRRRRARSLPRQLAGQRAD